MKEERNQQPTATSTSETKDTTSQSPNDGEELKKVLEVEVLDI